MPSTHRQMTGPPTSNGLSYPEALYVGPGGDWFASEAVL